MDRKSRVLFPLFLLLLLFVFSIISSCKLNASNSLGKCEKGKLMELKPNNVVSAQVLLRSASGKVISTETIITSENIKEYLPSDATIARAKKYFIDAEFEVGKYIGVSFAITAPVSKFEKIFNSPLCIEENGNVKAISEDGTINYELPLGALPDSVKSLIIAITFTPLPAFGPTNFEMP